MLLLASRFWCAGGVRRSGEGVGSSRSFADAFLSQLGVADGQRSVE